MYARLLTLIGIISHASNLFSQTVAIIPGNVSNIHPLYSSTASTKNEAIHVRLQITGVYTAASATIVFNLIPNTITNGLLFTNGTNSYTYVIQATEWGAAPAGILEVILNVRTSNLTNRLVYDEFGQIIINGRPEIHTIRLTNIGIYTTNKPFWIELGANFDVAEGFKPTNLYAGIFLYKKDVVRHNGTKTRLGILGGVYESKSSTGNISSDSGLVYRDGRSFIKVLGKGYPIFRDTGILSATVISTNVGLFFSPQIRLDKGTADADGFHVFASIWTEQLWQTVKTEFDYSKLDSVGGNSNTLYVSTIDSVETLFNAKTQKKDQDYRSHYFGIGLPMYLKEGDANLYVNPIFWGMTNQPYTPTKKLDNKGNPIVPSNKKWNSFYLLQFRLSEEKFGFTFTGEIRGLYMENYKPTISIALSKKIDLDNIGDYVQKILKF